MAEFREWLWAHRNYFLIVLIPLLALPLPLVINTSEAKGGYAIILMALYWCTECMPLAATALLPIVLFPMMGIMTSTEVCMQYLKDINMLFVGGLLVAVAVESCNLHKRIALRVLLLVGVRPALLLIGFMSVTAFLSMWISNTATTSMMLPIAHAVVKQLSDTEEQADARELGQAGRDNQALELSEFREVETRSVEDGENEAERRRKAREEKYKSLSKGLSLCVCYSASIGGTATLTGTTPNLILKGQLDLMFPGNKDVINFASWFAFAFPNMLMMLVCAWLWLQCMYLGFNLRKSLGCGLQNARDHEAYQVMRNEYRKLGAMTYAEANVLALFSLLVALWFTREPGFMPGWASLLFNKGNQTYVTDSTVAILVALLLFALPSQIIRSPLESRKEGGKVKAPPGLLTWQVVHERMPWNIILLLGGGFALAHGSEKSNLSQWLGNSLIPLQNIPPFGISVLLCLLVATFTECSSNVATTTLFLPILASMAIAIKIHPLYVMLPCTISASLAFMLPVATAPNAIAFSYGNLKVIDMAKAGFMLNIIGVFTINLALNTWGAAMFGLNEFPSWANITMTGP
ncbi:solute carrier family 13 member 2-like isoform X2 [Anguilla anguilla]|uniref:solute carrier family 13 member 2-like isoform X2 n=1 Tax=Anguilla anguilla TaxID=7936 RepID=UPI0015A999FA|nr:solute carrier family 13 member 2-like isoform X2 [Anguilla anguilla]